MNDIQKYNVATPVANQLLRRLQAYNTRILDETSAELIELFVSTFGADRIKELRDLGELPLDVANQVMTVQFHLKDIGVNPGRHPSRVIAKMMDILETIKDHPYILYTTEEDGKTVYNDLPLIKYRKVDSDGLCTVIFNDALRYLFFPDKFYGLVSFALLREIRRCNIYAGILYEEACSYAALKGRNGQDPYFCWSLQRAREKFGFDRMMNFDKEMLTYDSEVVKSMRPDVLRKKIFEPALAVLEDFFNDGKLECWLDLDTRADQKKKGPGRPPKDFFRFSIRRNKRKAIENDTEKVAHPDLFGYEEMNTLYYIREQLKEISISEKMIKKIVGQLQRNEQIGTHEEVLATIKNKRSVYDTKPPKERANLILSILGKEHHLGNPDKFGKASNNEPFWPSSEDLEGRIKVMSESSEIKDRASRDFGLSSQEVDILLQGEFYRNCKDNGKKLKKDWADAVDYFFKWLNRLGIQGPLNNIRYGNNKQTKSNYERATTSNYGQSAAIFLSESAD